MKIGLKNVASRAAAVVAAGALVLVGAGPALAAPPYEPDSANQLGQLVFYDTAGNVVTSGSTTDDPFAKYVVATSNDPIASNSVATLYGYLPQNGVAPGAWSGEQLSGFATFPASSAPAPVATAGANRPVVTNAPGDTRLADLKADFPNTAPAGDPYEGLYQIRLQTNGNSKWWAADVKITGTSWQLVYPTIAATTTTLTASPASPQTSPAVAVTLKATLTDNAPGTVKFIDTDTSTQVGSTQTLPATGGGTNFVTVTIPAGLAVGSHHYRADYLESAGSLFDRSQSSVLTYQVNAPASGTTTSLAVTQTGYVNEPITFDSDVTNQTAGGPVPAGTVSWYDNGGASAVASASTNSAGHATATIAGGFPTTGIHSVVAKFVPTDSASFNASESAPVEFTLAQKGACADANSQCTDVQPFKVTVPVGTLVISTPWTTANPFDLGSMQLDPTGSYLHAAKPFGSSALPAPGVAYDGVTITDTRGGDLPWSASASTTDFTSSTDSINGQNLGFDGVNKLYIPGNALNATKPVVTNDVDNTGPATIYGPGASGSSGLKGGPHEFAKAANGNGTVYVYGSMDLYAPTSSDAGTYFGTVTFTIA
jgi:hypothetical protein